MTCTSVFGMKQESRYVIGIDPLPPDVASRVMTYRTASGSVGYEVFGSWKSWCCRKGDVIVVKDSRVSIDRMDKH